MSVREDGTEDETCGLVDAKHPTISAFLQKIELELETKVNARPLWKVLGGAQDEVTSKLKAEEGEEVGVFDEYGAPAFEIIDTMEEQASMNR